MFANRLFGCVYHSVPLVSHQGVMPLTLSGRRGERKGFGAHQLIKKQEGENA